MLTSNCYQMELISKNEAYLDLFLFCDPIRYMPIKLHHIAFMTVINVQKLQLIHTLTATDVRASKAAKIKKLYCYSAAHRHTSMCSGIVYDFFIFAVLDARTSVAVNVCINCSFFTLIFAVFLLMSSPISCMSISTVNQTFDYFVVNLC